jgi:O-antigen ligase
MLFLLAGLPVDWRECRQMMYAIALSGFVNIAVWHWFIKISEGRLYLEFGSIANANDFAAHLLVVLPFLLFIVLAGPRSWFVKVAALALIVVGIGLAMSTGSRGGLLALLAGCGFLLLKSPGRVRIVFAVIAPLIAMLAIRMMPEYALQRQATLFTEQDPANEQLSEAAGSAQARLRLLKTSVQSTLEHPIVGVGPGQFLDYEGFKSVQSGRRGAWQVAHNSYTQVSSEAGLPALFFLLAALVSTYLLLSKTYRQARTKKERRPIAMAALCILLSLVGFCVSILFLSLIYKYYLPVLSGLAISLASAAEREFAAAPQQPA